MVRRRRRELKPFTFTTEELRTWRSHKAKCECEACMKVKGYYGRDKELEEIMSKYEEEIFS